MHDMTWRGAENTGS